MALGSRRKRSRSIPSAPPPPSAPVSFEDFDDLEARENRKRKRRRREYETRPAAVPFTALLDVTELDERRRPGPTWQAKACELGTSRVVIRARRMCYRGRQLLIAVHLIDDKPTPLYGIVHECVYDCDGMHRIDIDLEHIPIAVPAVKDWIDAY